MLERLRTLYDNGKLSKEGLKNAVGKKLITADQYEQITGEKYKP